MFKKNKELFLRKYFLFLIPLLLLILYFLYPIPVATFKGISQAIDEKRWVDEIITTYENQKILYEGLSIEEEILYEGVLPEVVKTKRWKEMREQWEEKCIENCLKTELGSNSFSPEKVCKMKCISYLTMGGAEVGGEVYFTHSADRIDELKKNTYTRLFFRNFNENVTSIYQKLFKIFHFQNLIIIFLGLILYYGVIFGINITKRLEKQK